MIEKDFKHYSELFSPMIKKFIDSNVKFYGFKETIRWCFVEEKDVHIFATCGNDNIVRVNLLAVIDSYSVGDIRQIEYFLLHEIRHIFQNIMINDSQSGKITAIDSELIQIWIDEKGKYQRAVDDNGNENLNYFKQDLEMDAYAFSLGVMKYKYGDVSNLFIPSSYGTEFNDIVNKWIEMFTNDNL